MELLKEQDIPVSPVYQIEETFQDPHFIHRRMVEEVEDPDLGKDRHIVSATIGLQQNLDIRKIRKVKSYKGWRHTRGLKVRGQRQRRTKKGTLMGVVKKKVQPTAKPATKEKK